MDSLESKLAAVGNDVKGFFVQVAADVRRARQTWALISSSQTRSILVRVGADAIKFAKDSAMAVEAGGLVLALDAALVEDIKQLVADAKTDGVLAADLKILGIAL